MRINDEIKKVKFINSLKGFTIATIILANILSDQSYFKVWICSFNIPLFFILNGFLSTYEEEERIIKKLSYKFKSIMVPYILFSCISIFWQYARLVISRIDISQKYIEPFLPQMNQDMLIFLPTLFIADITFYLINRSFNNKHYAKIAVITLFLIALLGMRNLDYFALEIIQKSLIALGYYSLGSYSNKFIKNLNMPVNIIFILFSISSYCALKIKMLDINYINSRNIYSYLFTSITLSYTFIYIFKRLLKSDSEDKILSFIGTNEIFMLSTNKFIINCINQFNEKVTYNFVDSLKILFCVTLIQSVFLRINVMDLVKTINNFIKKFKRKESKYKNNEEYVCENADLEFSSLRPQEDHV